MFFKAMNPLRMYRPCVWDEYSFPRADENRENFTLNFSFLRGIACTVSCFSVHRIIVKVGRKVFCVWVYNFRDFCDMVFLQLGKEIQPESIGELSSSPESAGSSLSQTNSLTEVINDWRRELEEKNCLLREKNSLIQSLEEQLKHRHEEIVDIREQHQSIELDRDKNCQMVSFSRHFSLWKNGKRATFVARFARRALSYF